MWRRRVLQKHHALTGNFSENFVVFATVLIALRFNFSILAEVFHFSIVYALFKNNNN